MSDNGNGDGREEFRFEQEVEKLLRQEPFVPFQVILTSGDRYDVSSPFSLAFRGNAVVVFPPRQAHIFFRKSQLVGVEVKELAEQERASQHFRFVSVIELSDRQMRIDEPSMLEFQLDGKRPDGWSFTIDEASAGHWVVVGRARWGSRVERHGTELEMLISACLEAAKAINQQLIAKFGFLPAEPAS